MTNEEKRDAMKWIFDIEDIPYIIRNAPESGYQFNFSWHTGDVITDPFCGNPRCADSSYVESYGFPWDEDDVTRDTPEEMAKRIVDLYQRTVYDKDVEDEYLTYRSMRNWERI